MALLSFLIATLTGDAIDHVLGFKTAHEAWSIFQDIFTAVSKSIINMLKIEFQTLQKGTDSIDKFLSRLKFIRDQLIAAGEVMSDNDMIIAALAGLPREYAIIWTVILARETYISLKEFRVRLLNTERDIDNMENTQSHSMAVMYLQGSSSSQGGQADSSSQSNFNYGISSVIVGTVTQVLLQHHHLSLVKFHLSIFNLLQHHLLCSSKHNHHLHFHMVLVMVILVALLLVSTMALDHFIIKELIMMVSKKVDLSHATRVGILILGLDNNGLGILIQGSICNLNVKFVSAEAIQLQIVLSKFQFQF